MITLTVPVSAKLHAHNSGHWRAKAAATKQARELARMLVHGQTPIEGVAVLDILFHVPDRRRRDLLNMCQSLKPVIDGVVDAGIISGDHWEVLRIGSIEVVKQGSIVEAVLTFRAAVL